DDVLVPRREPPALHEDVVLLLADHLGRDVADDPADLLHLRLVVLAGLRDERRVRRDAVDDAPVDALPDLFELGRVEEELHAGVSCRCGARGSARPLARAYSRAAWMNDANRGCGRLGRDRNSGWYCVPR